MLAFLFEDTVGEIFKLVLEGVPVTLKQFQLLGSGLALFVDGDVLFPQFDPGRLKLGRDILPPGLQFVPLTDQAFGPFMFGLFLGFQGSAALLQGTGLAAPVFNTMLQFPQLLRQLP